MKRLIMLCLAIMLVFTMAITVFAHDSFVTSPSGNAAPGVIVYQPDENCDAEIVVTPYNERDTLPDDHKDNIEKAYDEIVKSDDLTELNNDLKDLADKEGIDGKDLAVSDLFNIHFEGCDDHEEHKEYHLVLSMDTLENFVGLLYRNSDGNYVLVKDAKVVSNGEHLEFKGNYDGPFAVVVDTDPADTPVTGDTFRVELYLALMLVSFAAMVVTAVKMRKQRV